MINFFRKSISLFVAILIASFMVFDANATRDHNAEQEITAVTFTNSIEPRVTGLIYSYIFSASKDGTCLLVRTSITCSTSVIKCGIKEMVIQRRSSASDAWSDYATYEDLYDEDNTYGATKSLYTPTGFQYRAVATLYAKKSLLSTEKVEVTSNIVTM